MYEYDIFVPSRPGLTSTLVAEARRVDSPNASCLHPLPWSCPCRAIQTKVPRLCRTPVRRLPTLHHENRSSLPSLNRAHWRWKRKYLDTSWPPGLFPSHGSLFSSTFPVVQTGQCKTKRLRHVTFPTRSRSCIDPFAPHPPPPGHRYHGHAPGAMKTKNRRRSWKPYASRYVGAGSVAGTRSHRGPEPLAAQDGIPSPTSPRQLHWWGVLSQVSHSGQARPAGVQGLREPSLAPSGLPEVRFHCPMFLAG